MMNLSQPDPDQIEFILFGPGYGECAMIHLGENQWIIVDSCLNKKTGKPAALDYFQSIGTPPEEAVKLIVISHWHDDHIRGLSDIVLSCPKTSICCSSALTKEDFIAHILHYKNIMLKNASSGVKEITKILEISKDRPQIPIKRAIANRLVLDLPLQGTAHSCKVTTLSPSDKEFDNFLKEIGSLVPVKGRKKTRAPSLEPNDTSVAIWIEVGDVKLLLGSDLEEKNSPLSGWCAIVKSKERPEGKASVFKIPHHGSLTGHNDNVWSDMVIQSPFAILSPFRNAGTILPMTHDVSRILGLTSNSYITTRHPAPRSNVHRSPSVERSIKETVVGKIRATLPPMGWVSLRNGGRANPNSWNIQLSDSGSHLKNFYDKFGGHNT